MKPMCRGRALSAALRQHQSWGGRGDLPWIGPALTAALPEVGPALGEEGQGPSI